MRRRPPDLRADLVRWRRAARAIRSRSSPSPPRGRASAHPWQKIEMPNHLANDGEEGCRKGRRRHTPCAPADAAAPAPGLVAANLLGAAPTPGLAAANLLGEAGELGAAGDAGRPGEEGRPKAETAAILELCMVCRNRALRSARVSGADPVELGAGAPARTAAGAMLRSICAALAAGAMLRSIGSSARSVSSCALVSEGTIRHGLQISLICWPERESHGIGHARESPG